MQRPGVPLRPRAVARRSWPADPYEVLVFHDAPLSDAQREAVEWIERSSGPVYPHANCTVVDVDLSGEVSETMREVWARLEAPPLPCTALRYPGDTAFRLAFLPMPLTMDNVKRILDSPARRELAKRIFAGDSAVWVVLESGDAKADDEACALLQSRIDELESTLVLPGAVAGTFGADIVDVSTGPEIGISFSILRVSRDDPAEEAFAAMFLYSEPGLLGYDDKPMAFPVYGRGRALYALVGKGINERNIRGACEFLTGACSCEVKALNPGVDLLVAADWDAAVTESWVDADLPPLVGVSELVTRAGSYVEASVTPEPSGDAKTMSPGGMNAMERDSAASEKKGGLMRNILIAVGALILVIVAVSAGIGLKKDA